jgi:hypothetical protein
MTRRWTVVMGTVLAALLLASPAAAQGRNFGVRAGVSADPDQFFFGGHYETKPLLKHLTFKPSVEIGIGDDTTLIALNVEFAYRIPIENQPFWLYVGGGPAANIFSQEGDDHVGGGFNFFVGLQHTKGLFTEFKVGVGDSASLKFMVGYAFK